ncbi:hypothetical protein M885DRAFT_542426 [Pelagophyceae sp. CCMP2097]|nr:hypothetical protein M885DRAFT_542426 [Pelagophyceae sp. CCMP2097]
MGNICKISTTVRAAHAAFEDPVTERRTNALLDRWRAGEIVALRKTYHEVGKLDRAAFLDLFNLRPQYADAFFKLFDAGSHGSISFRDFCRALAWACGDRVERLRFVFCVFCVWEDADCAQQLLHEEHQNARDEDQAHKLGRAGLVALCDFCEVRDRGDESHGLTFRRFVSWAEVRLPDSLLEAALLPLHLGTAGAPALAPSRRHERLRVSAALRAPVDEGEAAFIVAAGWYERWRSYVEAPDEGANGKGQSGNRPDEVDNSPLHPTRCDAELRPGLLQGKDYVVLPERAWQLLRSWYGGGPTFARSCRTAVAASPDGATTLRVRSLDVDLYPLLLRVSDFDPTGCRRPRTIERVDRGISVEDLEDVLQRKRGCGEIRLWLKESPRGDASWVLLRATWEAAAASPRRSERTEASRWPREAFVLCDWAEILVEVRGADGGWARAERDFRDFRAGDRVDACDSRGKWFGGSIVGVEAGDDFRGRGRKVCVHFDRFSAKWDEWFDASSSKIAKPSTRAPKWADENEDDSRRKRGDGAVPAPPSDGTPEGPSTPRTAATSPKESAKGREPSSRAVTKRQRPDHGGAVGLLNLGNTCYLNSALQCLSHTPLLRSYVLSDRYAAEVNRANALGTQGRMCEEFACVLKQLWAGSTTEPYAPHKFKRTLARLKQQFANSEQQDSQEFLGEMLDMLHEDCNRVLDKPDVPQVDCDDAEAWHRHLLRHRSIVVDLFQGQLKSEKACQVCSTKSTKFEAFSFLTLPLPAREQCFRVIVVHGNDVRPLQFTVPRLGNVADLKQAIRGAVADGVSATPSIGRLSIGSSSRSVDNVEPTAADDMIVADVYRHRISKIFDDAEALVSLRDDETLVAYVATPDAVSSPNGARRGIAPAYSDASERAADESPAFPTSLRQLGIGSRVDALDHRGEWFGGAVVAVEDGAVRVHFDRFSAKWDEWFNIEADRAKLAPPLSKSNKPPRLLEIHVVHRREVVERRAAPPARRHDQELSRTPAAPAGRARARSGSPEPYDASRPKVFELFGLPLVLRVGSERSCRAVERLVTERCRPFCTSASDENNPNSSENEGNDQSSKSRSRAALPMRVRTAALSNPATLKNSTDLSAWPKSRICDVLDERRMVLVVDWAAGASERLYKDPVPVQASEPTPEPEKEVTLETCLDAFTKEEMLSEDDCWFCPKCKERRPAKSTIQPWKLPDILVIHLKRFLFLPTWREKIRTNVVFPMSALDLAPYVGAARPLLFDLFAVTNHVGRLEGGHYTAYAKATPCSADGVEDVASPFPEPGDEFSWLHFDDDAVEEVPAASVVTEHAYVLFYRKRTLTPSTVINLANFGPPPMQSTYTP